MIRQLKRRAYLFVAVFSVLLGGLVAGGASPAVAATPAWSLVPVNAASAPSAGLGTVSCWSSTGCLAANYLGTVVRRNGAVWTDVSPGGLPAGTIIEELSCATATFCVLAGQTNSAMVLRSWDGTRWHTPPAPIGLQFRNITGLSCPTVSFCAAVGEGTGGPNAGFQPVVMTWNGSTWIGRLLPVAGALVPNKTMWMGGISCQSAKACVAVGNTEATYGFKFGVDTYLPFASSFNGTSWTAHQVPNALSPAFASFYPGVKEHHAKVIDVSCWAAQSCAVTGQGFFGSSLLKYVNGTWKLTTRSSASTSADSGVSCTDAKHCVAVHATDAGGNVDLWNGQVWHSAYAGEIGLEDVSCVSNSACVAVGGNIAEVGPGTWMEQQVPLPQVPLNAALNEISCSSDTHCVAISDKARVQTLMATWNGSSWATSSRPDSLQSITCPDDTTCFAVGPGGIILRLVGGSWQLATTTVHASLLSCSSAISCLALSAPIFNSQTHGWHENVWRLNGQTWSAAATLGGGPAAGSFPAQLSCPTASFCLAAGQSYQGSDYFPVAYSWNGSTWAEHLIAGLAANSNAQLVSVSCTSPTNCMAVGQSSSALTAHWDGSALTQVAVPSDTSDLVSVSCSAADSCVAITRASYSPESPANNSGALIWNGVSWTSSPVALLPSGKNTVLSAVSCSTNQCMAVGGDEGATPSPPIAEQLK